MPKVVCARCGEELMGSVNRCWRCGRTFVAASGPDNLPPIRRAPIPLELVNQSRAELDAAARQQSLASREAGHGSPAALAAEVLDESPAATANSPETTADAPTVPSPAAPALLAPGEERPRPLGGASRPSGPAPAALPARPYYPPPRSPDYRNNAGATGGAVAAVVLGVMALVSLRLIAPGALLISILGVGMGVWGLYSERRTVAVLGLLLCCIAMSISAFFTAVEIYEFFTGYSPFEANVPAADDASL